MRKFVFMVALVIAAAPGGAHALTVKVKNDAAEQPGNTGMIEVVFTSNECDGSKTNQCNRQISNVCKTLHIKTQKSETYDFKGVQTGQGMVGCDIDSGNKQATYTFPEDLGAPQICSFNFDPDQTRIACIDWTN